MLLVQARIGEPLTDRTPVVHYPVRRFVIFLVCHLDPSRATIILKLNLK